MNSRPLVTIFFFVGLVLMSVCGTALGRKVGVTWEFAGFGFGILFCAIAGAAIQMQRLSQRLESLERKLAERPTQEQRS